MTTKHAVTAVPVHDLIASRWSPRAFARRPVESDKLHALLEAARWAPSAYNLQPWRFLVWRREHDADSFEQAFGTLSSTNQSWISRVPVLIGVLSDTRGTEGKVNGSAAYDTGAAVFALSLQAESLGLHLHQIGGFDRQELRARFQLPVELALHTVLAIGYRDEPEVISSDVLRQRELSPRERRPLNEIVFANRWQQSLLLTDAVSEPLTESLQSIA